MSNITPQMVKSLREKTGAGMADCKKALEENSGEMESAIEYLRKKGAASAAKRAEREAKEGSIIARTSLDGKRAILAEVNSETDFVAKNEGFVNYVKQIGEALITSEATTTEELMKCSVGGVAVENLHNDILAKFSEKIEIRRIKRLSTIGYIESYIHLGGKLAVLVEVSCDKLTDNGKSLLRDIAMQIAAMNPLHIDKSVVTQETLEKEKEIEIEKAIAEGKKPEIAERIATGKIEKYFEDFCLMQQAFVKDGKKIVSDVVAEIGKECGCDLKILSFTRWTLGGKE
ncbi:MAG: translation elongation factor Ts [Ignavibacteria bacterium]|jgi:elongation factor Ts|nr:translation elongation factor Ts [Ignavibacteria bacterium]